MFGIAKSPKGIVLCGRLATYATRSKPAAAAEPLTKRFVSSTANSDTNTNADSNESDCHHHHQQQHHRNPGSKRSRKNLSLFGPPGSGKGSYGRHFARALGVPLVTASDLLRSLRPDLTALLAEGKLVDDAIVGATVLEGLVALRKNGSGSDSGSDNNNTRDDTNDQHNGYVLDGFPRTLHQVTIMEETWPEHLRIASVVHLAVPDFVCESKLLGRRTCSGCGTSYNVEGVDRGPWVLPPVLPGAASACPGGWHPEPCRADRKREDDTPRIVRDRLATYHEHADPILERFASASANTKTKTSANTEQATRLLTLEPHRGFEDLQGLIDALRSHVERV